MGSSFSLPNDELDSVAALSDPFELRWVVDISEWRPLPDEMNSMLDLLPETERANVLKFKLAADVRRAVISRLLQMLCCHTVLGQSPRDGAVRISRTKGGKPYESGGAARPPGAPNFNFNVSHDGDYVLLAADPALLLGVDVTAPFERRIGPPLGDFAKIRTTFDRHLTHREWAVVERSDSETARVDGFRTQWALKEAFAKARGEGLALDFRRIEFLACPPPRPAATAAAPHAAAAARAGLGAPSSACGVTAIDRPLLPQGAGPTWRRVFFDGAIKSGWRGHVYELPRGHIAVAVRGPASEAIDEWGGLKRSFVRPALPAAELAARLAAPPPPFRVIRVQDLASFRCAAAVV